MSEYLWGWYGQRRAMAMRRAAPRCGLALRLGEETRPCSAPCTWTVALGRSWGPCACGAARVLVPVYWQEPPPSGDLAAFWHLVETLCAEEPTP
jgi:hypothetical protein